jgi:signal transduction histidine kinase
MSGDGSRQGVEAPRRQMNWRGKSGWLVYALALCGSIAIVTVMMVMSDRILVGDHERGLAEQRAVLEERARLALWQLDSAASVWIADEVQHSPDDEVASEVIHARFEIASDGELIGGSANAVNDLKGKLSIGSLSEIYNKLERASHKIIPQVAIPEGTAAAISPASEASEEKQIAPWSKASKNSEERSQSLRSQVVLNSIAQSNSEYVEKRINAKISVQKAKQVPQPLFDSTGKAGSATRSKEAASVVPEEASGGLKDTEERSADRVLLSVGFPQAAWVNGELFLIHYLSWKKADGTTQHTIQATWIDADAMGRMLLKNIRDLVPNAILDPTGEVASTRAMAALPFTLKFTSDQPKSLALRPEIMVPLILGWVAVLVVVGAFFLLVVGLMKLSERRASFVSAVTHELRTPLTTFQLYSELLATEAVHESKRGYYFGTLKREAERLAHLVENVLTFSQIERGSARSAVTIMTAKDAILPMIERCSQRLESAGLLLRIDMDDPAWHARAKLDLAAVEHIIFNLIDNAAKYAHPSERAEVVLSASIKGKWLELGVQDYGPGIGRGERRRIFAPFHKSAANAAESKPGVGLGLALSRRLAKRCGGTLRLSPSPRGCLFVLSLKMV